MMAEPGEGGRRREAEGGFRFSQELTVVPGDGSPRGGASQSGAGWGRGVRFVRSDWRVQR